MALIRWQPRETFALQNEIDSLVNRFWGDVASQKDSGWYPKVDVVEAEDGFEFHAELPGLKREDVKVSFEDGVLTISGERKRETVQEDKAYCRRERSYGQFKRSFRLGTEVDVDRISASYTDGVLSVTLPKSEAVKPRQIEVSVS
jgi:HSP20 family protein